MGCCVKYELELPKDIARRLLEILFDLAKDLSRSKDGMISEKGCHHFEEEKLTFSSGHILTFGSPSHDRVFQNSGWFARHSTSDMIFNRILGQLPDKNVGHF